MRIRGSLTDNGSTFLSAFVDVATAPIRKPALRGLGLADWKIGVTKKRARLKQKRIFSAKGGQFLPKCVQSTTL